MVTEFLFADGGGQVDLVAEDEEGGLGELFDSEEALITRQKDRIGVDASI